MLSLLKKLFGNKNTVELAQLITSDSFMVDVRSSREFAEGSVQGAVNIPMNEIQNNLAKFKNKKNSVVFCQSGMRSEQATRILKKNGIKNVYNGGGWRKVNKIMKTK